MRSKSTAWKHCDDDDDDDDKEEELEAATEMPFGKLAAAAQWGLVAGVNFAGRTTEVAIEFLRRNGEFGLVVKSRPSIDRSE
ncbi:hypothetical protein U1Q18_014270 [Sarracenia purpurea var. burkii]